MNSCTLARRATAISHLPIAALLFASSTLAQSTIPLASAAAPSTTSQLSAASNCPPKWIPTFGQATGFGEGIVTISTVDDGTGTALFTAHRFIGQGGIPGYGIKKWDGSQLSTVGGILNSDVADMVEFDDGTGPALYVGGSFFYAGPTLVNGVTKWTGSGWTALGGGLPEEVLALAVFDDGTGEALYAVESYLEQNLLDPVWRVNKWDGTSWSNAGGVSFGYARDLAVFDSGGGLALHVAIDIPSGGGTIRKWIGGNWNTTVGNIPGGVLRSLEVLNDGTGDALYVAGTFSTIGGISVNHLAKLNASGVWSALGLGAVGTVGRVAMHDDGTGPALHASGSFSDVAGGPMMDVGKWDGQSWSPLGNGIGPDGYATGLESFDDGTGASLYVGGSFASLPDSGDHDLARWGTPPTCGPGDAYCFGDGTGTACPCGNNGAPGNGCANSSNASGAYLLGFGEPSFFLDSFGLNVGGARANVPGLLLLADGQLNQGLGSPVGGGLLCVGGFVQRSQIQVTNFLGSASFFDFQGSPFGATAFGIGAPVNYQFWYRDNASPCTGGPFNFSNAWTATWQL